jgi:hypothetical protein
MSVLPPIVIAMTQTIVLPVPATVRSPFVVLAPDHVPTDLQPVLRRWASRVRGPCATLDGLQDSYVSVVSIDNAALGDAEALIRAGNPPSLVRRLWDRNDHLLVAWDGPPALSIMSAVVSFGVANALALASGGLLLDPLTCEITGPDQEAAEEVLDLTEPPAVPVLAWVRFWADDQRVHTRGMTRFGLPELSTQQIPHDVVRDWTYVLAAAGSVLIEDSRRSLSTDPRRTFLEVDNPLMLCDRQVHAEACALDLLAGPGRPPRATPIGLRLDFSTTDDSTVELCRPDSFTGAHEEWLRHTAGFLLEDVRR